MPFQSFLPRHTRQEMGAQGRGQKCLMFHQQRCHVSGCFLCAVDLCKRCRMVVYCSRKCQLADWKSHKKVCKMMSYFTHPPRTVSLSRPVIAEFREFGVLMLTIILQYFRYAEASRMIGVPTERLRQLGWDHTCLVRNTLSMRSFMEMGHRDEGTCTRMLTMTRDTAWEFHREWGYYRAKLFFSKTLDFLL